MGTVTTKNQSSKTGTYFLLLSLFCFLISLLIHFLFFQNARKWEMPGFSPASYDTIIPRTFRMKRVEIDPKTMEEDKTMVPKMEKPPMAVPLEKEIPQTDPPIQSTSVKSILSNPTENLPVEKPETKIPTEGMDDLLNKPALTTVHSPNGEMPKSTDNQDALGMEQATKLPDPGENDLLKGMEKTQESGGKQSDTPQFSSLDDLLSGTGTVKRNTAPILMPTDLLFEYDSDALKPAATATLTKLGSLIKKNAKASFRIEGHTDSFGTDDYNNGLSLRRAEAVKSWLGFNMGIDASRISTIGLGKSRLLVPATGSVEQQQLNRRVEIVITVPK